MVEVEDNIINQILIEVQEIKSELNQLKEDNEKYYWFDSIQVSLSKVWDNKADEEWSKLL